jgi:hypothetical protein
MKNFSTISLILAFTMVFAAPVHALSARCGFKPNAPDQHLVVRGDTLWGISGKFLENAFCWPEVWGMNKEEIRNPHLIYPGQIVYLDRANNRLRLGKPLNGANGANSANEGQGQPSGDLTLKPQIRTQELGDDAITSIPAQVIEPFLSQPLIVEVDALENAARVVATQEGRVFLGTGDKAFVRGDLNGGTTFQVFRPSVPLIDPTTKKIIGYEAFFLGTMNLKVEAKAGSDVHIFTVADFKEEIGVGDRLLPLQPSPILNYVPHPPAQAVNAQIVSIYGGVVFAGTHQVVTVNRGSLDGLDLGAVLELSRNGNVVVDKTAPKKLFQMSQPLIKLPGEVYGTIFIFRTFKNISYGLIMNSTDAVVVGDFANSPQ